jgi:hypothetical protein
MGSPSSFDVCAANRYLGGEQTDHLHKHFGGTETLPDGVYTRRRFEVGSQADAESSPFVHVGASVTIATRYSVCGPV